LTPGQSYAEANAENQALRKSVGWYGKGDYMQGRGGYIGKIAGGLIGGLGAVAGTTGATFATGGALAGMAPTVIQGATMIGAAAGSEFEDYVRDKFTGNA